MLKRAIYACCMLAMLPAAAHATSAIDLPKTGQNTCWNSSGAVVTCAGTGQDGDKQGGMAWPSTRFTASGSGLSVTDSLTGLMWTKDANLMKSRDPGLDTDGAQDGAVSWQHALDYVNQLNTDVYDGYNDWRLPNINELESMINLQQANSATWLNLQGFTFVQADSYWSSTTYNLDKSVAWHVNFTTGYVGTSDKPSGKSYNYYVWPVRDAGVAGTVTLAKTGQTTCWDENGVEIDPCAGTGQDGQWQKGAAPTGARFGDNGDGTITDNLTGLIWLKNRACLGADTTMPLALEAVKNISTGTCGLTDNSLPGDWRLPNRKEMMSLVDRTKNYTISDVVGDLLVAAGFIGFGSSNKFCTSSTSAASPGFGWIVYLGSKYASPAVTNDNNGFVDYGSKSIASTCAAWAVRSGQWGHPVISVTPSTLSFGSVATSTTSSAQVVTIKNTGTGTLLNAGLAVSSIGMVTGTMFSVDPGNGTLGTCGPTITLPAGESCTVSVTFSPTTFGAKSDTLRIVSNDQTTANKDIAVSGTGTLPSYVISTSVVGGNGTINCTSPILEGSSSTCTITPNANYYLATLTDNAVDVLNSVAANRYTISNVTAAHTVAGTFAAYPPIDGVCGSSNGTTTLVAPTANFCSVGSASAVSGSGPWTWTCAGQYSGVTASCAANKLIPVKINNGASYTTSSTVTLQLTAPNGEGMMRISTNPSNMGSWKPFAAAYDLRLTYGDGQKVVYVNFKDVNAPANATYTYYTATINLDTVAPRGTLVINGKASVTYSSELDLTITAQDKNGVVSMCIKEDSTVCAPGDYEAYSMIKKYQLINAFPGRKTITVRLKDVAGRISTPLRGYITLK